MNKFELPFLGEPTNEPMSFEFGLLGDMGDMDAIKMRQKLLLARLGYNVPMDGANLNFGVTGQKLDINSPYFNMNEQRISGLDATYSRPDDFFRISVDRQPQKNSPNLQNILQLLYGRNF